MKIPKRTKYMLLGSMLFMAISLRYPFTPHEIGWDSFFVHGLVSALNDQGHFSSWWLHPLSPFGLTPFSYPSAVPVVLSALSQTSGLSIDSSIWLFGILCGIISVFGSYLVAKEVFNNDLYVILVVFAFVTSEELLNYTTWTLSTRGLFITMLPFFLFFLFRKTRFVKFNKYSILAIVFFVFLVSIHHLYSFLMFPLVIYLIFVTMDKFYPIKEMLKSEKINKVLTKMIEYVPIIILFAIISGLFADIELVNITEEEFEEKNTVIVSTIRMYARNLGVLGLFGIFGFFLLAYKFKSNLNHILLLFFTVVLTPFILISTYMTAFIAIFMYLLAGFSLYLIFDFFAKRKKKVIGITIVTLILLISLGFSTYYQVNHPGIQDELKYNELYMEEDTYDAGIWLKYTINGSSFYSNDKTSKRRIGGVMNLRDFPGDSVDQLQNDFITVSELKNRVRSPLEPMFWQEDFYEVEYSGLSLFWYGDNLQRNSFNSDFTQNTLNKYDIKYIVQNDILLKDNFNENSTLFISLNKVTYKIYSNERLSIWFIN